MNEIHEFKINVTEEQLSDLKARLKLTRWPSKETPDDWTQGVPLAYMQKLHDYWLNQYDWRARQEKLNQWAGYTTNFDGLDIHFLHIRSPHSNAKPLLLTHGWPGSIVEFQKVISPLTDPVAHNGNPEDAFHVVCPSLPGFGFSGKPTMPGWGVEKIATAWNTLMVRLGYDQYFAQGGDWGAIVTTMIGIQNLGNCKGIHLTMPLAKPDPDTMNDLSALEKSILAAIEFYQEQDSGYSKQQTTRPQTLGYALADSPIGQAAWIIEKFYQWMDCNGQPESVVTFDELLDNVMLYWLPNAGVSSARLYWESFISSVNNSEPVTLPVGCSIFPKEFFKTSERWARKRFNNLIHFNLVDKGGHFAVFEQPQIFVKEVRDCFRKIR